MIVLHSPSKVFGRFGRLILRNSQTKILFKSFSSTTSLSGVNSIISENYFSKITALDNNLLEECWYCLEKTGYVHLPGFVQQHAVEKMVNEVISLENHPLSFQSTECHNIWLENITEECDDKMGLKDPQKYEMRSSKRLIAADLISPGSPARILFEWDNFAAWLAKIFAVDCMYRMNDKQGKFYYNVFNKGDELGWHFDRSEFSVSLILQASAAGGHFEFIPNSRSQFETLKYWPTREFETNKMNVKCERVLQGGSLYLFCGQRSLHRVTPVVAGQRMNIIFTYSTKGPDERLNEYTLKKFFGRTG
mmetsp:Transcript_25580/g.31896  ORF Transcript_25580/g.31896 Transcript_25580/m.31896 type:complete len:306 (-) Transcript_25580:99-1016(-)